MIHWYTDQSKLTDLRRVAYTRALQCSAPCDCTTAVLNRALNDTTIKRKPTVQLVNRNTDAKDVVEFISDDEW